MLATVDLQRFSCTGACAQPRALGGVDTTADTSSRPCPGGAPQSLWPTRTNCRSCPASLTARAQKPSLGSLSLRPYSLSLLPEDGHRCSTALRPLCWPSTPRRGDREVRVQVALTSRRASAAVTGRGDPALGGASKLLAPLQDLSIRVRCRAAAWALQGAGAATGTGRRRSVVVPSPRAPTPL